MVVQVDHKKFKKLLRGDAGKKAVVDRAIADLQWGPEGVPIHPVINGSDA